MPRAPLSSLQQCEWLARNVVLTLGNPRGQEHVYWYSKDGTQSGDYSGWNVGASAPEDLIVASRSGIPICHHHNHPERGGLPSHPPSSDDWQALCGKRPEPVYAGMNPLEELWVHGPGDVFYCFQLAQPADDVWAAWQVLSGKQGNISYSLFGHPVVGPWWFHHTSAMALELAGFVTYRWNIPDNLPVWNFNGTWGGGRASVRDVLDIVAKQLADEVTRATFSATP